MGYMMERTICSLFFTDSFLRRGNVAVFFDGSPLNRRGKIKMHAMSNTKTRISLIPVKIHSENCIYYHLNESPSKLNHDFQGLLRSASYGILIC